MMRISRENLVNALSFTALLLALIFGLTACGSSDNNSVASRTESAEQSEEQSEELEPEPAESDVAAEIEQAVELTLADAEAKLICKNESWIAVAYYGPENVRLSPCWNGEVDPWPFGQYGRDLSSGWTVAYILRRPEIGDSPFSAEELEGLGLVAEDREDESSSVTFENLEQMSETEMRAIGLPFLDGHRCLIGTQTSVGGDNFRMIVDFSWMDEMSEADSEGFLDRVSFFAGDGTPLDHYFDGYTLETTLDTNITFTISVDFCSSSSDEEQNKTMIQELKASEPYMIYTGLDGEVVKTSLSWE